MQLPVLREELSLHPGPIKDDGAPTWTLRDPVRGRFFQIGWTAFEILARWPGHSPAEIVAQVNAQTTLAIDEDDVLQVAEFLQTHQLVMATGDQDIGRFVRAASAEKTSWLTWLLHHYLFFRIPLVRPDEFLARTSRWVEWIYTRAFAIATSIALVMGLFLVYRQWDVFKASFVDTLTVSGMISYGVAYAAVKIGHELAHAYTAKRLGCHVPSMGVAFLVMWPVLYTDVNDAWILPRRRQRLAVGSAGILAEITFAAWSLLAWSFMTDGPWRNAMFAMATVTLVSSLAVNLSPCMRFDGYYILMDLLNMPNLHPRSFALARWWMREKLFNLGEPSPEPNPPVPVHWLIFFALFVWLYRLTLFLGIAVLVYHFFIKIVGIGLFLVEIGWFVIMPVVHEMKEWAQFKDRIATKRSALRFGIVIGAMLLALIIPWRDRIEILGLLKASESTGIYISSEAQLVAADVTRGQKVTAGQRLFLFKSPDLEDKLAEVAARKKRVDYALSSVSFDKDFRANSDVLRQEQTSLNAQQDSLKAEAARLTVTAPMDGVVLDIAPDLHPGDWLSPRDRLASVQSTEQSLVEAYVGEEDVKRLEVGDEGLFIPDAATQDLKRGKIVRIDHSPVRVLAYPELASVYGGRINVRAKENILIPDAAIYRVQLEMNDPEPVRMQQRGMIRIAGHAESLLGRGVRFALAVFMREWGI